MLLIAETTNYKICNLVLHLRDRLHQVVIVKLVSAIDTATNSLHCLLPSAAAWLVVCQFAMPYLEIPAMQSIQHFVGYWDRHSGPSSWSLTAWFPMQYLLCSSVIRHTLQRQA